ncbi:MAG: ATP-binding cassette domain-containing protein [Silicimonas sp.]|nr:ATP-binding cassette domain-containing protein [Silicimonas sp.]
MKHLFAISLLLLRQEKRAFALGLALAALVLAMGVALLSLSGWFITAAAAAGLAGLGALFNVFIPSALVRFLALGRTAARYGERLTTHDATLRTLANLRLDLIRGLVQAPYRQAERLRASRVLNRVTSDVDALDGLPLRLVLPALAGLAIVTLSTVATGLLAAPALGGVLLVGHGVLPSLLFWHGAGRADKPARRSAAGMQAMRSRMIDLVTARDDLAAFGQLRGARHHFMQAIRYHHRARSALDRFDRGIGFTLEMIGWSTVAVTLALATQMVRDDTLLPAQAAIAIFAALALTEAVAPVRRAMEEIGQMRRAASRILPMLECDTAQRHDVSLTAGPVELCGLELRRSPHGAPLFPPLDLKIAPGEMIAITGPSGCGKSTLLLAIAGQIHPHRGHVSLAGHRVETVAPETLARHLAIVPQRHALVAGTIAENLRLADPEADEAALWQALEATNIAHVIRARGGLEARLGFRGAGLSGGEARRLVLARALLRKPDVLLLDEPTEGLDGPGAARVMVGMRAALPQAVILVAAHRPEEIDAADRRLSLSPLQASH